MHAAMAAGVSAAGATSGAAGAGGAVQDPRLKPAAHEFEACLMKEFLAPLQEDTLAGDDGDGAGGAEGDSSAGSNGALMSFGSEALAKAISERGGFGIATKIVEHYKGAAPRQAKTGNTGSF